MTERDKARERARLLLEWADEKTLQMLLGDGKWVDHTEETLCAIHDPSCWRVKPEPRRKWELGDLSTDNPKVAAEWKAKGYALTEWQEVLP